MKNIDFKRFVLVLRREWQAAWKMLAVYAVLSILLLIVSEMNILLDITLRENTFYVVTVGGALVLASRVLANIWGRRRCISTLTLPASVAETFVARYLLWLVLPLLFAVNMLIIREFVELHDFNQQIAGAYSFMWADFWRGWGFTILLTIAGMHAAMLGGAFFNRLVLVKTAATFGVAFLVLMLIVTTTSDTLHTSSIFWPLLTVAMVIAGIAVSFRRFTHRTVSQCRR
ncbi:MAG: hypothetical protein IKW77_10815 [Salinivirgaceae bacterium]|nr:hypothetical protein [Salinivirgaceae bacterium]